MNRTLVIIAGLAAAMLARSGSGDEPVRELPPLPPFLEVFQSVHQVTVTFKPVQWASAAGMRNGLLARADDNEALPALIVLADDAGSAFYRRAAREFAEIGYAALVVELPRGGEKSRKAADEATAREQTLAALTAAVRWLRRRDDVFPDRIGAVAWSAAAPWALELAADQHLQACVVCDGQLPRRLPQPLAGQMHDTSVLLISGTARQSLRDAELLAQFKQSLASAGIDHRLLAFDTARPGFTDSSRKDVFDLQSADRAWFEMYEFLGKHVEDADVKQLLAEATAAAARPRRQIASIADLMRAVNAATGVRGQLAQMLGDGPADDAAWKQAGSRAALLAESGELLSARRPPKGKTASWLRHAVAYRDAATSLSAAAAARDLSAARAALLRLNNTCGKCHLDHR